MPRAVREHYTLVCRNPKCQKIIYMTRSQNYPRPVRYSLCALCAPVVRWDYRQAPAK